MVQLRMFGRVSLTSADGHEVGTLLSQPRRFALLAYLCAATPRGLQRRDTLLPFFWPELDQEHARTALRQALRVIRNALGPQVLVSRGDEEVGVDFEQVWSDVAAFDCAIEAGQLVEALNLYRGPLLEGFFISDALDFERWLEKERARLQQRASAAAGELVAPCEKRGDLSTAVHWARQAVQLAPNDEALVRRLITLLDRHGNRAGALEAYEEFARRLAADYEAVPATVTQTLIAAVRTRALRAGHGTSDDRFAQAPADTGIEVGARAKRWSRGRLLAFGTGLSALAAMLLLVGLKLRAGQAEPRRSLTLPTTNVEAYNAYTRGKVLVEHQSRESDSVAITLFERAVALDPTFAAAEAELSHAYRLRATQFARGDSVAFERAQVAADRALRLDPNLAEAHHAEASLLWWTPGPEWSNPGHFNHERAIQEDKRAIALNPNLDRAHHLLGNVYLHIGLLDRAIVELERVLLISPRDDNALRRLAEAREYQGKDEEALATLRQVDPKSNPALWHYQMASLLLHVGRTDEAFALIRTYLEAHPEDRGGVVTSARAVWYAMAGDARRAEQDIRTTVEKGKGYIHFHEAAFHIALAYALLHQPDSAVHWLRRVADGGMPCYPLFASDPFLNNIRNDAGFVTFLREQRAQWEHFRATL